MELEPYLHFGGSCEEALTFYKEVFAGEVVQLMRFGEMDNDVPPDYKSKVMHASFKSPHLKFMASDQRPGSGPLPSGAQVSLSLSTRDVTEGERVFAMLGAGGNVTMAFQDTFWGARFGTLTDKFGIAWMVNAEKS